MKTLGAASQRSQTPFESDLTASHLRNNALPDSPPMSSDLLSEFDTLFSASAKPAAPQTTSPTPIESTKPRPSSLGFFPPPPAYSSSRQPANSANDDDEFGSFTTAPTIGEDPPPTPEKPVQMQLGITGRRRPADITVGRIGRNGQAVKDGPPTPKKDVKFTSRTRANSGTTRSRGSSQNGEKKGAVDLLSPSVSAAAGIPDAQTLLASFPPLFSLPHKLLISQLAPLSYPIRRRIISDEKTQIFLHSFLEIVRVAGRLIAFLNKPVVGAPKNASEKKLISILCEGVVDEYARVRRQVVSLGIPELKVPTLEGSLRVVRKGVDKEACEVCRLGKAEIVMELREELGEKWWIDNRGHRSCLVFIKDIYGRRWGA